MVVLGRVLRLPFGGSRLLGAKPAAVTEGGFVVGTRPAEEHLGLCLRRSRAFRSLFGCRLIARQRLEPRIGAHAMEVSLREIPRRQNTLAEQIALALARRKRALPAPLVALTRSLRQRLFAAAVRLGGAELGVPAIHLLLPHGDQGLERIAPGHWSRFYHAELARACHSWRLLTCAAERR